MECDVAVLGGGSGGYPAAIRATQLGASVVCVEQEAELGGTCLRVGCIPTKAWVQTALALKEANETFEKLGVKVGPPELDFGAAQQWKEGVVKQLTGGVATLFKANGIEWVKGVGRFKDANTLSVEGAEDITFKSAIVATGLRVEARREHDHILFGHVDGAELRHLTHPEVLPVPHDPEPIASARAHASPRKQRDHGQRRRSRLQQLRRPHRRGGNVRVVDAALDAGVTFFDTADIYGGRVGARSSRSCVQGRGPGRPRDEVGEADGRRRRAPRLAGVHPRRAGGIAAPAAEE